MATDKYFHLWTKAFGISAEDLAGNKLSIVTSGFYVERHKDKYVFCYFDEANGKTVLACSENNLVKIKNILGDALTSLKFANIRTTAWFKEKRLDFNDIDFCLSDKTDFKPVATAVFDIRPLYNAEDPAIEELYLDCSEDDKDTLDLTFENEKALGVFHKERLAGIARYVPVRDTQIADITVLVRNSSRGQGLSTPLVSQLVEMILADGFVPKYRVAEDNLSSIAIAKKLGFAPRFRVLTWAVE